MATLKEALDKLQAQARPDQLEGMARFGMATDKRLGLSVPTMRRIAKELGKDHKLALALWKTGIPEAQIVAALVDTPESLTEKQMDAWVKDLKSWDVCDQVCGNLFDKSPLAWKKAREWAGREEEFVRRAAFALMAYLAWHDQETGDEAFIQLLPVIQQAADDERNFVKKADNWALRGIGKRSARLKKAAIQAAREIQARDSKAARWIAADALRELTSPKARPKRR